MLKVLVTVASLMLVMSACSSSPSLEGDVDMTAAQKFAPEEFTVEVGESVSFVNSSNETHTVTAYEDEIPQDGEYFASGDFDSEESARADLSDGLLDPDETYEVTFETPGTYRYFCIPHETQGMTGTIVVEEASG